MSFDSKLETTMRHLLFSLFLLLVASCFGGQTALAQAKTKEKGQLMESPSASSEAIGLVLESTTYRLISSECTDGFYHVATRIEGSRLMVGWLHGQAAGLNTTDCDGASKPPSFNRSSPQGNRVESTEGSTPIRFRQSKSESPIGVAAVLSLDGVDCTKGATQAFDEANIVEQELLGLYDIVDRTHLEMILDEQRLALSGLVMEEGSLAKAGCLAGAQGTVVVTKGCLAKRDILTIKMLDCSSSMMYWVATGPPDQVYEIMAEVRSMLR